MDLGEAVTQQPVSILPALTNDIPDSREEPPAVVVPVLPYPTEPVLAEQELAVGETPTALQSQDGTIDRTDNNEESTGKLDGNGNVEKVVDSSVTVETVVLQQIKETVDIELDITGQVADAGSRSHDGTVVVVSDMPHGAGHVELLIEQAGGKSNAEGIAVEVVLNEAGPATSEAQLPLGADGGGLEEIPISVEIGIIGTSTNVDENESSQPSVQTSSAGYSVEIEAIVVTDASATVNSSAISLVDELGVHGAGAESVEGKELDVTPIVELEQVQVDKVIVSAVYGGNMAPSAERNSAAVLLSIEEPQFTVEGEIAIPVEGVNQVGTGDASTGVPTTDEMPLPSADMEGSANTVDHSTADVSNVYAPEAVKTFDRGIDIVTTAEEALVTGMVGGSSEESTMAAESNVVRPFEDMMADGLLETVTVPQDVMEVSQEDVTIVVDLDASVGPEEGTGMEDFADLLVVPATVEPERDAGGPMTSSETDISAEQSSIFVQLGDIPSPKTPEALKASKGVEEEKSGEEDAIPSGGGSVAGHSMVVGLSEDAVPVAIGVTEPIEEPSALMSAAEVSCNLAMPDIQVTSTVGEPGIISTNTSIPITDGLEDLGTGVGGDTGEELPVVERTGTTAVQEILKNPTATHPLEREELINSEEINPSEPSSVNSIAAANIPGSTDEPNGEEIHMEVIISISAVETSPLESALANETVTETPTQAPVDKIQEDSPMESSERTEEQPATITFQQLNAKVEEDEGISWEESVDKIMNAVEEDDTEMVNALPDEEVEAGDPLTITESMLPEEGIVFDDLVNPPVSMVAIEETTEITICFTTTAPDSGGAAAEDVDGHGVLVGVGSSVESRGLTITEIAETTGIVEEFRAERQISWGLSEPLITPPEEEIIEAIGDLVDGTIADMEPEIADGLVLLVHEDGPNRESSDLIIPSVEGEVPSETIHIQNQNLHGLDDVEQLENNPNKTAAVAIVASAETRNGEPFDLQDANSLLTTSTLLETETAADNATLATPLGSPLENEQPTGVTAEIALESLAQEHLADPLIRALEDKPPTDLGVVVAAESVVQGLENVPVAFAKVEKGISDADNFSALESGPVSIAMSSYNAEKLSSIDETATNLMEQVTSVVEGKCNTVEGASDAAAPSGNGSGLALEAALDTSVLSSEVKAIVSAEAGVAAVESDIERNEKKRGREEEAAVVGAENKEKTAKAAKTSNGEISVVNDAEANNGKIGEAVQVDKKRPRDELEKASAEHDAGLLTKAQKTGSGDDDAGSLSRKADNEGEADAEESVDMEDKEVVVEKKLNGAGQPRYKKRKIALFLGYSGAGYQGMQKNPGAITIEGELEEALFRAGAIAESNYGQPSKLDWRRAARTDKGVSAVGQVVSGCFFIDPPGFIERVNSHLPKQIRVYGYKRATASFSAKKLCDRRKYEYVLPVYAFDPTVHLDRETAQALAAAEKLHSVNETETMTTVTQISGPVVETEASMVIDNEMKESAVTEQEAALNGGTDSVTGNPEIEGKEKNQNCSNGMCPTTEEVASTITDSMKISDPATEPEASMATDIQMKESAATEGEGAVNGGNDGVTGNPGIEGKEHKQSSRLCVITEKVTAITEITQEVTDVRVNPSPEEQEAVDEKASTPQVFVQTEKVITEREEVTVTETVVDLATEAKKEALDEKIKKSTYTFGDAEFNRLNRILSGFVGHHNFHNFTVRTKATDPSANRYIISFGVENSFTRDGIEFVRCSVVGQSFMLHQIRKMIGLAVAIMRGAAPESILATALRRDTDINVPMAPELGLFLEECYYTSYNRMFHATHEEMSLNAFADEASEFKKEFIYPLIVSTEARNSTFAMWLHSLNDRHYPHFIEAREAEKLIKS